MVFLDRCPGITKYRSSAEGKKRYKKTELEKTITHHLKINPVADRKSISRRYGMTQSIIHVFLRLLFMENSHMITPEAAMPTAVKTM